MTPDWPRLCAEARALALQSVPVEWPELAEVLRDGLPNPLPPIVALPLASCVASWGDVGRAVPAAAAWAVLNLSLRVFDDLVDRDRPMALWATIGPNRAYHVAASLRELATHIVAEAAGGSQAALASLRDLSRAMLTAGWGQDRDLAGGGADLADWWKVIAAKTGAIFGAICRIGVQFGEGRRETTAPLEQTGRHLGVALQLLDDWESTDPTRGARDLHHGRATFPLRAAFLFGDKARLAELRSIVCVAPPWNVRRAGALLDEIGARSFTLWVAHQERERALACLAGLNAPGIHKLSELCEAPFPPLPIVA
jgi:geranylgeranyl diphosphate synthase type I